MAKPLIERDLKRSSASVLVLALLEEEPLHGYEIGKRIEARSGGKIALNAASLYPLLYRLEERGWLESSWGESENKRRAKYYKLTAAGRKQLKEETQAWERVSLAMAKALKV